MGSDTYAISEKQLESVDDNQLRTNNSCVINQ